MNDQNYTSQRLSPPQYHSWFHNLLHYLWLGTGNCLDLGCGDQGMAEAIESKGYSWIGLDVDIRFRSPRTRFVWGDGEALPFRECTFSAVFC